MACRLQHQAMKIILVDRTVNFICEHQNNDDIFLQILKIS